MNSYKRAYKKVGLFKSSIDYETFTWVATVELRFITVFSVFYTWAWPFLKFKSSWCFYVKDGARLMNPSTKFELA